MLVAFHIHRKPLSTNAKLKAGFMRAVAEAARTHYTGPLISASLYSRIVWFHKYRTSQGDADNMAKRIHDALKEIVFADDRVITHTMAVRVDATEEIEIVPDPDSPLAADALIQSLADPGVKDILYIELGFQTDPRVHLGPIA
jgi:Holliday junction resolvase RusA-like endonuclease